MRSEFEPAEARPREDIEQKIVDPITGMDITGDVLAGSRQEYENELEEVISEALNKIAQGMPKIKVWEQTDERIKALQQKLWDSHKVGWLQDWLHPQAGEDRFTRDLKYARNQLGVD